jgi:hypothetical protein
MIGTFQRSTAPAAETARCQTLSATFRSTSAALHQATDRADIKELKSRLKDLRRELRALHGACPPR